MGKTGVCCHEEWYLNNRGYRAQLVPYTFAKFIFEINKTGKCFNYKKVWENQSLSEDYFDDLRAIAYLCYKTFNDPNRQYLNIGEYTKREVCWNDLNKKNFALSNKTIKLLVDKDDLEVEIKQGSKLSIAAACFSIYAFQELKDELSGIDELRFIFTSPTFTTEKAQKENYLNMNALDRANNAVFNLIERSSYNCAKY